MGVGFGVVFGVAAVVAGGAALGVVFGAGLGVVFGAVLGAAVAVLAAAVFGVGLAVLATVVFGVVLALPAAVVFGVVEGAVEPAAAPVPVAVSAAVSRAVPPVVPPAAVPASEAEPAVPGSAEPDAAPEVASTPVIWPAPEVVTVSAAGSTAGPDPRPTTNHATPTTTTTASAATRARRTQYTLELRGPTGCITAPTVASERGEVREQRRAAQHTDRKASPLISTVAAIGAEQAGSQRSDPVVAGPTVLDPDRLAAFFARRGRDLPWRRPDAGGWAVLVSEVMLQQTPVARVLPVYTEWIGRWPTPAALAAEPVGEALRAWGRLGYPRRAMRLHAAAVVLVREHGGVVPAEVDALLGLPGVGEYTARAVSAFAYGRRHPVIDTNVRRVLSRAVRGIDEHAAATAADRAELERLLPAEPAAAAAFSAALMELGALHCSADAPACGECPLADRCRWLGAGRPAGPPRRPAQRWQGTDRQVRGAIMAALRDAPSPLPEGDLASDLHDPAQRRRCLDSLLADGLAVRRACGLISLP